MRYGLDKNGKRVSIDATNENEDYFCPVCGEKLVLKKGKVNVHHFAHWPDSQCTDSWHYDMSDWHRIWQERFPEETREVVKEKNGIKHRADVLIEDKQIVIEFQKSPLTADEFNDRNNFYNSLGYKVIWVFDLTDQYENNSIFNYEGNLYKWVRPKRTFDYFVPKDNKNVELFFQIQLPAEENPTIIHINKSLEQGYWVQYHGNEEYYEEHKNDRLELIKVTWAPEDGFKRFATDGYVYYEKYLVDRFIESTEVEKYKISNLAEYLIHLNDKDHSSYYYGCTRNTTGLCSNWSIDIAGSYSDIVSSCAECQYSKRDANRSLMCRKRFLEIGLKEEQEVEIVERDKNGYISKIAYEDDTGRHIVNLTPVEGSIKGTIFELWEKNNYKVAIFKNIRTRKYVKIGRNPVAQLAKYHGDVYGYISDDRFNFRSKSTVIYYCDRSEWICIWSVNKDGRTKILF